MAIIGRWKFWSAAWQGTGTTSEPTPQEARFERDGQMRGVDTRPRDEALVASPGPPSSVSTLGRLASNLGEHLLVTGPPLSRRPLAGRATRGLPRSESWTVFQWPASPLRQLDDSSRLSTPNGRRWRWSRGQPQPIGLREATAGACSAGPQGGAPRGGEAGARTETPPPAVRWSDGDDSVHPRSECDRLTVSAHLRDGRIA